MMEQYLAVKKQHPDKIVFFQVGDFYEIFFDDAPLAAREMDIALTTRDGNKENPIPLAGVPVHAAEGYLNRLLGKGYRVVVCDQVEEASQARGLVRRDITRILTPGTITDAEMLEEGRNNYLVALTGDDSGSPGYGLAAVDVSTGDFRISEARGAGAGDAVDDELRRLRPAECICTSGGLAEKARSCLERSRTLVEEIEPPVSTGAVKKSMVEQWGDGVWESLHLDSYPLAAAAAATALSYLAELHRSGAVKHLATPDLYFPGTNMAIDSITARNLELTQSIREGGRRGSLLGLLDRCMTGMGRRLLRRWIEQPLVDGAAINERLDAVSEMLREPLNRRELRGLLQNMIDLERFCSRLCFERVNARDLVGLKNALRKLEPLEKHTAAYRSALLQTARRLPSFADLTALLEKALVDDPPPALREGGLFRDGYNTGVDRLKETARDGKSWLVDFEKKERQRTGIKSLRIGFNRNFGYFIEVTRTNLDLIPVDYQRRQTLVNAERFVTEELSRMEQQITGAREKLVRLEYDLFVELRSAVQAYVPSLQVAAQRLALLDCLQGLAETAEKNRYCRPQFTGGSVLRVKEGRHPVVEQTTAERFVPNDAIMDEERFVLLITGPNMAGKSTYIRSIALICLMGQMGSFVPAQEAELPVLDRVFARVGASDDLSQGYSTFMVEMQETATILRDATPRSLLVLDEIGRGTSTYDGMSIARSVLEFISSSIRAKTLFSTHYHELTGLEGEVPGIRNYTMAVKEKGKDVIFLRQVVPGRSDKSYGINVARLAGIPAAVTLRAEAILAGLETASASTHEKQLSLLPVLPPADLSAANRIADELRETDINRITPLEALQLLYRLQQRLLESSGKDERHTGGNKSSGEGREQ